MRLEFQFRSDSNNKLSVILKVDDFIRDNKSGEYNTNINIALASSFINPDERALGSLYKASVSASINDESEAIIDFFSDVDIIDHSIMMQGSNVLTSFKGKQKGTLTIDIATGLLRKSISRLKISGEVEAMGMKVPIEADLKTEISRE